MVDADAKWTVTEGRRFKHTTRMCELCTEPATRVVDVKHGDEEFGAYVLCDSAVCLSVIKENAGV